MLEALDLLDSIGVIVRYPIQNRAVRIAMMAYERRSDAYGYEHRKEYSKDDLHAGRYCILRDERNFHDCTGFNCERFMVGLDLRQHQTGVFKFFE